MTRQTIRPRPAGTVIPAADVRLIYGLIDLRRWLIEQAMPEPRSSVTLVRAVDLVAARTPTAPACPV